MPRKTFLDCFGMEPPAIPVIGVLGTCGEDRPHQLQLDVMAKYFLDKCQATESVANIEEHTISYTLNFEREKLVSQGPDE
jgi:hypothetical protein